MVIDYRSIDVCACGKPGCIEMMASGPGIARLAHAKAVADPARAEKLRSFANGDISAITAESVAKAWRARDPLAREVLLETVKVLTVWLGNTIDMLEPDVIVVGGGVGELISQFFDQILNGLPKWSINQRCREIPLKLARYRADSGIAGAAALCRSIKEEPSSGPAPRRCANSKLQTLVADPTI